MNSSSSISSPCQIADVSSLRGRKLPSAACEPCSSNSCVFSRLVVVRKSRSGIDPVVQEQAKLKARAPLANKNNNTLARKPAFAPSKLGDLDLFAEAKYALHSGPHFSASPENVTDHCNFRSAYFPRATEQLKQAELELKGWKPVATVHELTAAA